MNTQHDAGPHVFSVDTVWTGGIRTTSRVRDHEVVADGPLWRYGTDDGPAPGELLLASVGACFVNHLVRYMQVKRAFVDGVEAKVTGEFRFEAELEVYDRITFDVTVTAPPRMEQVVEKAFKVAQRECTLLMIVDVKKEFALTFRPSG
ncbi:MAG: OsmC family protein [Thermoplasmata archaeon]|nr:MAG: OsmC family protein [Thermoplasmata archaeon]